MVLIAEWSRSHGGSILCEEINVCCHYAHLLNCVGGFVYKNLVVQTRKTFD
jgi:hypothetical protein